jgi:TetR/AcrR family transcriptional regulator, cholesterol catabolism regulator
MRAATSFAASEWHNNFHLLTANLFRFELEAAGAPADGLDAEVMMGVFTVEGLLMHTLTEQQQRSVCDTLAARWISTPNGSWNP